MHWGFDSRTVDTIARHGPRMRITIMVIAGLLAAPTLAVEPIAAPARIASALEQHAADLDMGSLKCEPPRDTYAGCVLTTRGGLLVPVLCDLLAIACVRSDDGTPLLRPDSEAVARLLAYQP